MVRVPMPSSRANIYLVHMTRLGKACTGVVGRATLLSQEGRDDAEVLMQRVHKHQVDDEHFMVTTQVL